MLQLQDIEHGLGEAGENSSTSAGGNYLGILSAGRSTLSRHSSKAAMVRLETCSSCVSESDPGASAPAHITRLSCRHEITIYLPSLLCPSIASTGMTGPGWRGAVQTLSTVPTIDWVLLGSGESMKWKVVWQPVLQLACRRTLPLAGTACNEN